MLIPKPRGISPKLYVNTVFRISDGSSSDTESLASGPSGCMLSAVVVASDKAMSLVLKEPRSASGVFNRERMSDFVKGVGLRDCK